MLQSHFPYPAWASLGILNDLHKKYHCMYLFPYNSVLNSLLSGCMQLFSSELEAPSVPSPSTTFPLTISRHRLVMELLYGLRFSCRLFLTCLLTQNTNTACLGKDWAHLPYYNLWSLASDLSWKWKLRDWDGTIQRFTVHILEFGLHSIYC